jgi:hypothetical protein
MTGENTATTVAVVDQLIASSSDLGLPELPRTLHALREKLADDSYALLVCGRVKDGKSTMINALIGAPIVPTDVDVATSHVFRVQDAAAEAYRLRFDDGTCQVVTRHDLARYGSQRTADAGERPDLRADLRWIEVDRPGTFLPPRVAVLDTPGYGSLYAAHTQVTRRFLPFADGVVFVIDTATPLNREAVELIEEILAVTPRIFFVQTKIDMHSRAVWQEALRRNEQILTETFGDRLPAARVHPMSSVNLLAATGSADPDALLFVSRYPDLVEGLRRFIDEMCAAPRVAEALTVAARQHAVGDRVLRRRLTSLAEDSRAADAELRVAEGRSEAFAATWGASGQSRADLVSSARRVGAAGRKSFAAAFAPGGQIRHAVQPHIDAVRSAEDANQLGAHLGDLVIAAAVDEWNRTTTAAGNQYATLLAPFLDAADTMLTGDDIGLPESYRSYVGNPDPMYERMRTSYRYVGPIISIARIALSLLDDPLTALLAAGGALWGAARGWRTSSEAQLRSARAQLDQHYRSVLEEVRGYYFAATLGLGDSDRVDDYFAAIEQRLAEQVDEVTAQRVSSARVEADRIRAQTRMQRTERATAQAETRDTLAGWTALGEQIASLLAAPSTQQYLRSQDFGYAAETYEAETYEAESYSVESYDVVVYDYDAPSDDLLS